MGEQEVAEVELDVLQPEADAAVDGRPVDDDTVLPNGAHKDLEFVTPAPTDQTRSSVAEQLQNAPEASPAAVETIRCPTCKGTGKVDKTSFLSLGQKMCKTCMGKKKIPKRRRRLASPMRRLMEDINRA